jgi:HD superfamily phosphohydrolase
MSAKDIYDPIHGFISISFLAQQIIDTYEFQRMRDIKQLGATYFVFPSATHTRFEHSIGVYYLCDCILNEIKKNQPTLKINKKLIELIKIAGLIHDIGQGPFSHLYDNYIVDTKHEERSKTIFKKMVLKYKLQLSPDDVLFICDCIEPPESKKNKWYFQIVSNKVNHIDVDKIDYILRDAYHIGISISISNDYKRLLNIHIVENKDDESSFLSYHSKLQFDIYNLFLSRYKLNKMVYTHHSVKAFEYLIIPILQHINSKNIEFLNLTDSYILNYSNEPLGSFAPSMEKYNTVLNNIYTRNIPKLINEITILNNSLITKLKDNKFYNGLIESFNIYNFNYDDYILEKTILGFSNSEENPLNNVYYYDTDKKNNPTNMYLVDSEKYSFIIPLQHNELILRLYSKTNKELHIINGKEIWNYILIYLNLK